MTLLSLAALVGPFGPPASKFLPRAGVTASSPISMTPRHPNPELPLRRHAAQAEPYLEVRSVPALPGLEFRLFRPCSLYLPRGRSAAETCFAGETAEPESWTFKANQEGIARIQGRTPGLYVLQVGPWESPDGTERAEFSRWEDEVYTAERAIVLASGLHLAVGMNLHRQVRLEFQGPTGETVPAGRVSGVVVRSSFGAILALEGEGRHWVLAERSLRRDTGLESVPVAYAVQQVAVDGSNVVNRGQLRLVAAAGDDSWTLPLLLYRARIEPRDALFGGPVAGRVVLEFPDGRRHEAATGADRAVEVSDLARGTYRVWVVAGPGVILPTLVVLSRDQLVRPPVITVLDIGVVVGGGTVLTLGLLFAGRPHLLTGARRRPADRPGATAAQAARHDRKPFA